jgi:hypothetical protein
MMTDDLTGKPVTASDVDEAIAVVTKMAKTHLTQLPPELAVQLMNIRRCLLELRLSKGPK